MICFRVIVLAQLVVRKRRKHIAFTRDTLSGAALGYPLQLCLERAQALYFLTYRIKLTGRDARCGFAGSVGVVLQFDEFGDCRERKSKIAGMTDKAEPL